MTFEYVPLRGEVGTHVPIRRRASVRYGCAPATRSRVVLSNSAKPLAGWALDLSAKGIGLSLPGPLVVGTFGIVQLKSGNGKKNYELAGQVVHSTLKHNGDWLVAFEFLQALSQDELDEIL